MALTNNKYNSDGTARRATGYLSGTYTAATVASETTKSATSNFDAVNQAVIASGVLTLTLGWVPKFVRVRNVTDRLDYEWEGGMNNGDYFKTIANGTRTLETDDKLVVNVTTGVVTVDFSGLSIGDNDTVTWKAEG